MSKAYAFVSNNSVQALTSGANVSPGTAQHGFGGCACGCIIQVSGNNINLRAPGYYNINIGATVTDSVAGNVTLALYQDGVMVAQGSENIADVTNPASIAFPAGVKVNCNSTLTLIATSSAGDPSVNNIYITVAKQ